MYELDVVTDGSLRQFVGRWYGLPDRPPSTAVIPPHVPAALAGWYLLADRYSYPLSRDHVFRPPSALADGAGPVVFWEGAEDAYAYAGDHVMERTGGGWVDTGLTLARFLVYAAVYEATYAPLHGLLCLDVAPRQLDEVRLRVRPLDDPLWTWPDPAFGYYGDEDLLAHLGPGRVMVAARHRDALGRFDPLDIAWDWDSRRP